MEGKGDDQGSVSRVGHHYGVEHSLPKNEGKNERRKEGSLSKAESLGDQEARRRRQAEQAAADVRRARSPLRAGGDAAKAVEADTAMSASAVVSRKAASKRGAALEAGAEAARLHAEAAEEKEGYVTNVLIDGMDMDPGDAAVKADSYLTEAPHDKPPPAAVNKFLAPWLAAREAEKRQALLEAEAVALDAEAKDLDAAAAADELPPEEKAEVPQVRALRIITAICCRRSVPSLLPTELPNNVSHRFDSLPPHSLFAALPCLEVRCSLSRTSPLALYYPYTPHRVLYTTTRSTRLTRHSRPPRLSRPTRSTRSTRLPRPTLSNRPTLHTRSTHSTHVTPFELTSHAHTPHRSLSRFTPRDSMGDYPRCPRMARTTTSMARVPRRSARLPRQREQTRTPSGPKPSRQGRKRHGCAPKRPRRGRAMSQTFSSMAWIWTRATLPSKRTRT